MGRMNGFPSLLTLAPGKTLQTDIHNMVACLQVRYSHPHTILIPGCTLELIYRGYDIANPSVAVMQHYYDVSRCLAIRPGLDSTR